MYVQVLEKVSPNPREVKCVAAQNNPSKNRSTEFLPGIYGLCQIMTTNVFTIYSGQMEGGTERRNS